MKISIDFPEMAQKEALTSYVTANLEKLGRVSDRILESKVVLTSVHSSKHIDKICRLTLVVAGKDLCATTSAQTFEMALLKAIQAVRDQIDRLKDVGGWRRVRRGRMRDSRMQLIR